MSAIVEVNKISKLFRLGTLGSSSLRQDLSRWWNKAVLNKEDVFFQERAIAEQHPLNKKLLMGFKRNKF